MRLFVLIYFKLDMAEGCGAMVPSASLGRDEGEFFFYVDFFFSTLTPFPSPFGAPGGFSHLPIWSLGLSLSVDSNL